MSLQIMGTQLRNLIVSLMLLIGSVTAVCAQTILVQGKVLDSRGTPLPKVSVTVKLDNSTHTTTDKEGKFSLQVPEKSVLVFTLAGKKTTEAPATTTPLEVTLEDGEEQQKGSTVTTMRQTTSIQTKYYPLWVIDGVVYKQDSTFNTADLASTDAKRLIAAALPGLSERDIESFTVITDASATALYGNQATGGVISVRTRHAGQGINRFTYTSQLTYRFIPSYREFNILNSQDQMSVLKELEGGGSLSPETVLYQTRYGVYGLMYDNAIKYKNKEYLQDNTLEGRTRYLQEAEMRNTDWFKELFRLTPMTSHTVSFSAGGRSSATYASLGFFYDGGWTVADRVQRITANLKNTFYLGDRLQVTLSAQGNIRSQNAPGTLPQRKSTTLGLFERDFDINPFSYALGTSRTLLPSERYRNNWAPFNIHQEYRSNHMDIGVLDFKAQAEASYKVLPHLEARALVSTRQAYTTMAHEITERSNQVLAYRAMETPEVGAANIYLLRDPEHPERRPEVALPHGGILKKDETSLKSYLMRLALDYDRRIGPHDIKAFGFTEIRYADRSHTPFTGYGVQYDRGGQINTDPRIFSKLLREGEDYFAYSRRYDRGVTFSASTTYGYDGRYILNALINMEGSNASGRNARTQWLPTWNVGGKWNVDREAFFHPSSLLSRLAVRMSYGLTAKMNEEAVNANSVYQGGTTSPRRYQDRENALRIRHLENRDLTWEKMYELNLGLETAWAGDRVRATVDLYQRNAFDLIDLVRTSGIGGQYYKYANFGDMRTQGIELSLSTTNIETKELLWSSSLILSLMNQKITRLLNTPNALDMVAGRGRGNLVGYPKGSLFSYNFQGLNSHGLPTFDFGLYPTNHGEDANVYSADFSDTQYTKSYLTYHGPIEPQVIGGLSNTLRYGLWDLTLFITAQAGNKIRLNPTFDPTFADLNVFSGEYRNRWMNPGDEQHTDVPTIPSQDLINAVGRENIERAYSTYNYSQIRVADGSFVRLKHVSLGYRVSEAFAKKLRLHSAKLQLSLTNPFLIYSDKRLRGQDPEYYRAGGVSLPTPRQYTLSLQIGF